MNQKQRIEEREFAYKHIPLKTAFTVRVTYKRIGQLKPRIYPLVD